MKRNIIIGLLSLIGLQALCQKVTIDDIIVGKNFATGKAIKGKKYTFSQPINMFHIDSNNQTFTIELRKREKNSHNAQTGGLIQYDLLTNTIKSSEKLGNAYTTVLDNCLMSFTNKKIKGGYNRVTTYYDLKTGKPIWHTEDNLAFIDRSQKIAITCEIHQQNFKDKPYILTGIDVETGQKKWTMPLNFPFGLDFLLGGGGYPGKAMYLNDSTILIRASGLHAINIKTGASWQYKVETGLKVKKTNTITTLPNGMTLRQDAVSYNFKTGFGYLYPDAYDALTGLHSNLVKDNADARLYFASKDDIACLDYQGHNIWSYPFPEKSGSTSTLSIVDSFIYVINYGSASTSGGIINYGQPFIAAFNKKNGQKKFFTPMLDNEMIQYLGFKNNLIYLLFNGKIAAYSLENGEQKFITTFAKKETFKDAVFKSNGIYILSDNKIAAYALDDGHLYQQRQLTDVKLGQYFGFERQDLDNARCAFMDDSTYQKIDVSDTAHHYIFTDWGHSLAALDTHFKLLEETKNDNNYHYSELNGYRFISTAKKALLLDEKNHATAVLIAYPYYKAKDTLYCLYYGNIREEDNIVIAIKVQDITDAAK
jgi:outer membrane protein assembly factor BamB